MSLHSLCRWQVQVSVYCARRIPAHFRCTQCPISLNIVRFYEEQCQPSSGPAWPACTKTGKSSPYYTICIAVCQNTVTVAPRVGCVVWSHMNMVISTVIV